MPAAARGSTRDWCAGAALAVPTGPTRRNRVALPTGTLHDTMVPRTAGTTARVVPVANRPWRAVPLRTTTMPPASTT